MQAIKSFIQIQQRQTLKHFSQLNEVARPHQVLFTGSSLMEQFPISELVMSKGLPLTVYNRGIGGFTTDDMCAHLQDMALDLNPSKIFINIGTNDMSYPDYTLAKLLANYDHILTQLMTACPSATIYLMAYYPINEDIMLANAHVPAMAPPTRTNQNITLANEALEQLAAHKGIQFINVNAGLMDEAHQLNADYTTDGIHMYSAAYQIIFENLLPYLSLV